jgi:hypothetical protein
LIELAKSELAAIFSVANVYFWKSSGYFDQPSFSKPLLHTWSLAVEEQFYFLFPLLLLGVRRFLPKRLKATLLLLSAASFVASVIGVHSSPAAAFFLPQTRAWEFLTGVLVALEIVPVASSKLLRNLASLAGLLLIGYAAVYTDSARFPGAAAISPCLGAALVIYAGIGGSSAAGDLLSTRPAVFIGLISYSLYLWHWPLLLMNDYEYFPGVHLSKTRVLVVILAISALSWRFIEQPFRSGPLTLGRRRLFEAACAAVVVISAVCIFAVSSHGLPARLSPADLEIAQYPETALVGVQWGNGCFAQEQRFIQPTCFVLASDRPNYLLFGDSHAADLWLGLTKEFPHIHFVEATAAGCRPLLINLDSGDPVCRQLVDFVFNHFLPTHRIDAVILSGAWGELDVSPLAETLEHLHAMGIRVDVVGPIVIYDQPLPDLLIKARHNHDPGLVERHAVRTFDQYTLLDRQLDNAVISHGRASYISLRELLCDAVECTQYARPGVPLQFDSVHLANDGSMLVAEKMKVQRQLP